jgi:predicted transcriptional regulator
MKPSPTEFIILKHIWATGAQSQGEIHKAVKDKLNWSRSSTRKTVERMFEKNMLSAQEMHGVRVYTAKLKKIPTIANMVRSFAHQVLGLDGPLPVSNLAKSDILSAQELEELDRYLKATQEDAKATKT